MKKIIWLAGAVIMIAGMTHADFTKALFKPGETLNPGCSPTDADCKVLTVRPPYNYKVPDIAARDAIAEPQPGDQVEVYDLRRFFIYSQERVWIELIKPVNKVFVVADPTELDALTNIQIGDYAEVTSLSKTYIRTVEGSWRELLTPLPETYAVADLAAMNDLPNVKKGDLAIVSDINKTYIRLRSGGWQELLVPPAVISLMKTYVVADEAARDALSNLQAGDVAIVTNSNTSYIFTQDGVWQQLLVPENQVLSVNGKIGPVVLDSNDVAEGSSNKYFTQERARGAFSVSGPLSYDSLSGTFGLPISAPLALDGLKLTLDTSQITSLLGLNQQNALQLNAFGSGAGNTGEIRFLELAANGSNHVGFKAPDAIGANQIWTLPAADGTNGQFLTTDGSSRLSWITPPASATNTFYTAGNGLTLIGTTFSLSAPVSVANGGTGALTAETAFTALAPGQAGNSGKFLTTNGTIASWAGVPAGGGVWGSITGTLSNQSDLTAALSDKQGFIATGTTAQYYRGDKTFQTLDKTAVGLGNVENTALSSWTGSTNITTLGTISGGTWNGTAIGITKGGTGQTTTETAFTALAPSQTGNSGKFLTTNGTIASWASIPTSGGVWGSITGTITDQTDLNTALAGKEATITAGLVSQYYRGDKSFQTLDKAAVGLGSVENTALSSWTGSTNITTLGTLTGGLTIGSGGALITKFLSVTQANTVSASITKEKCGNYATITVTDAELGNSVIATPRPVASGIETTNMSWNAYVSAADTVIIRACNTSGSNINTPDTQTWAIDVWAP